MSQSYSFKGRLALSAISMWFVDRFVRSLRFAPQNLKRKPFLMVAGVKVPGIGGEFRILSDF